MSCPCLKREYYFLLRSGFCGLIALLLAACASTGLPQGEDAYANFPSSSQSAVASEYRIGPLDVLKITVFQEPDLSAEEVPVDASGNILLPLLGQMEAAGKTGTELSGDDRKSVV